MSLPLSPANLIQGRCIFTVSNPAGERFTFKISQSKPNPKYPNPAFFVSRLTGPDNLSDYTYAGMMRDGRVLPTRNTLPALQQAVRVADWVVHHINTQTELPPGYRILPSGRCCRCGRTLTVPSSIDANLGPECAGKFPAPIPTDTILEESTHGR